MTYPHQFEQPEPIETSSDTPIFEQNSEPLKKVIKEKNLKKQHHEEASNDDEPLYKVNLKKLLKHGVSQRVARHLCRSYPQDLIASVLQTAPQRPGIQNLAAYIVSEIKDGGYEQNQDLSSSGHKKNAHQVSGGRSNYAYLTDHNVKPHHHNFVKTPTDAPRTYPTLQQTRQEQQQLELERQQSEEAYHQENKTLAQRFKALPEDLQLRLKRAASVELSHLVPQTSSREQMLQDKTFQRLANRTVLKAYFDQIDSGLDPNHVFQQFEKQKKVA